MKTTDVFFKDSNFVGREIENVQDLVKALAAGMNIANADGCGYCPFGEREVTDEDGDSHYEEYEKTDEELFDEMQSDMKYGDKVYAGFFLDSRNYNIKPAAETTLQSNFYVGQEVFTMRDNKITKATISHIWLSKGEEYYSSTRTMVSDIIREMRNCMTTLSANDATIRYIENKIDKVKIMNASMAFVKSAEVNCLVNLSDIFATKEELINHLMEE